MDKSKYWLKQTQNFDVNIKKHANWLDDEKMLRKNIKHQLYREGKRIPWIL